MKRGVPSRSAGWVRVAWVAACLVRAEVTDEVRTWRDRRGTAIEAAFVRCEAGQAFLRSPDGKTVQIRVEELSEADRRYLDEVTYVPREITALFRKHALYEVYALDAGSSEVATQRDRLLIRTVGAAAEERPRDDTLWQIESVDQLGKRLLARASASGPPLETEGRFVFVTYTVSNATPQPVQILPPVLRDTQERMYFQADCPGAWQYVPEGTLFAGQNAVPPGMSKLFAAFYEVPDDAVPTVVEVYPANLRPVFVTRFHVRGKPILLAGAPPGAEADAVTVQTPGDGSRVSVFLSCVRLGQGSDAAFAGMYDRLRGRSLVYGVEMRVAGQQRQAVRVKAYFIAAAGSADRVIDVKQETVTLEPGKISRLSLQSETIDERRFYYYNGSSVWGVKPKGVIVQVWAGESLAASYSSSGHWKRFAEQPDVVRQMGELKRES